MGKSFSGKGVFPHRWAFSLLLPLRSLIFSARDLVKRLDLDGGMSVLEVGPGPGYFSIPLAQALPEGRLVLADIQPEMLAHARRRLDRAARKRGGSGFARVEYHLCDGFAFPFPDRSFDRIVLVTALGEVVNKTAYFHEFQRLLKPGGLASITELAGDPDRLSVETILELALPAGLAFAARFGGRWNYTVNLSALPERG